MSETQASQDRRSCPKNTHIMTIPHEWRVKSVNSPRGSNKVVSRERSSSETIFLLSLGELTDFTRH